MDDLAFFRARYRYDRATGYLHTKAPMHGGGRSIPIGSVAGSVQTKGKHRRIVLSINRDGKQRIYKAHRVIWLIVTGAWPACEIDHRDRNGTNNAWRNLRLATRSLQVRNSSLSSRNTSGYRGVSKHGPSWRAMIWQNGKPICLGSHATKELAHAAYCEAAQKISGNA